MASADHGKALDAFVTLQVPLKEALAALTALPGEPAKGFITLRARHLAHVLRQFQEGRLSIDDVVLWADTLEARNDVGYNSLDAVGTVLHELANPNPFEPLTRARAGTLLEKLLGE